MFAEMFEDASDYLLIMLVILAYLASACTIMIATKQATIVTALIVIVLFVAVPVLMYLILMSKLKHIMNMIAGNMH